jgi:hypothetical protein
MVNNLPVNVTVDSIQCPTYISVTMGSYNCNTILLSSINQYKAKRGMKNHDDDDDWEMRAIVKCTFFIITSYISQTGTLFELLNFYSGNYLLAVTYCGINISLLR